MRTGTLIAHRFVKYVPAQLEERTIYISIEFATATHLCLCGCGSEVVTPLSPTDWKLTFDGESISLDPSIGNWSLTCRSHYWIRRGRVHWASRWSQGEIDAGRRADRARKATYYADAHVPAEDAGEGATGALPRVWRRLRGWLR